MNIRPDGLALLTSLPNYINIIPNVTGNLNISGTITNGTTTNFSVSVPVVPSNTRCDIYGINLNNGLKQQLSNSNFISNDIAVSTGGIYQHKSTEFVQLMTSQGSNITVTVSVTNFTGSSITLVTQTIQIEVVQYAIPF